MKTYSPKASEIAREWHVVDASGVPLGRLATRVARLLTGKHKPTYVPHMDSGDHVIVINAAKIGLSGGKLDQKLYYRHSGYPGGFRAVPVKDELAKRPTRVVERAVKGMLPHTTLGRQMYRKLRVYAGPEHPHAGQVASTPKEASS
jgi:large subunit ribosomal protein L13